MASTVFAVIFICIGIYFDYTECAVTREFPKFSLVGYMVALGTILFTLGGTSTFPTIQHDMRRPTDFTKSALLGFGCIKRINIFYLSKNLYYSRIKRQF
jgi:vesicular inhibitory amino acid transporter